MFGWTRRLPPPADEEVVAIIKNAVRKARQDKPDVRTGPDEVLPEFAELQHLFQRRISHAQDRAALAISADVEYVGANAQFIQLGGWLDTRGASISAQDSDAVEHARDARRRHAVLGAAQRVVSASRAHQACVSELAQAGAQQLAALDSAIRAAHRHSKHLTYDAPKQIEVPAGSTEIGLARIRSIGWLWATPDQVQEGDTDEPRTA